MRYKGGGSTAVQGGNIECATGHSWDAAIEEMAYLDAAHQSHTYIHGGQIFLSSSSTNQSAFGCRQQDKWAHRQRGPGSDSWSQASGGIAITSAMHS